MSERTKKISEWGFVLLTIFGFLAFKLANLTFRFGDGNAYFYMAKAISDGQLPYRDFFLADPPVLVFLLAGLRLFFGNHLIFYQALPVFLEIGTALILFLLLRQKGIRSAFLSPLAYLFSFSVLATSDFLTGVQLTAFWMVLAFFFWGRQEPGWTGFFWALSFLTKLYSLPAFLGFLVFVFLSHRQHFLKILGGSLLALILALGPLAIIAFPEMLDCLLIHHLNRPGGLDKAEIFWFFIRREWWLILLGLGGLALNRKNELVPPLVFVFAFLLFFKDLYYTYLGVLVPFLLIFGFLLLERLTSARRVCSLDLLIVVFIFGAASLILSSNAYGQIVFSHGRFLNASEIADFIAAQPEPFLLYGSHEVAPLVALFSERDLFGPHIDTNPQVFASGAANLEKVSREASRAGVFLLARITDLPEYGVTNQGFQGFFSQPVFDDSCQEVKAFPSTAQESDNYIKVFKCHAPD